MASSEATDAYNVDSFWMMKTASNDANALLMHASSPELFCIDSYAESV